MPEPTHDFEPAHDYVFSGTHLNAFARALQATTSAYRRAVVMLALYAVGVTVTLGVLTDAGTTVLAGTVLVCLGVAIVLDGAKAGSLINVPSTKKEK